MIQKMIDSTNKCEQFLSKTIFVETNVKKVKKKTKLFFERRKTDETIN